MLHLPRVIVTNETSLDLCIGGFEVDMGRYYGLVERLGADTMLTGSETALLATPEITPEQPEDFAKPGAIPGDSRPLCVITDSRGRLRNLHVFRKMPYCSGVVVVVSSRTPKEYTKYLEAREYDYVVAGDDRIDYRKALEALYEKYSSRVVFTDSGGQLSAHLFHARLVSEVALLVNPILVGNSHQALFRHLSPESGPVRLRLISNEVVKPEAIHIRYEVV